jgi:chromate transporter
MTEATAPAPSGSINPPGLAELFFAFAKVSLSGFGGVLPWARRMMVEQRRWMTAEEFNEAFSLSQFLPGPNIVNFSVVFGARIAGPVGAVLALVGLLAPPIVIVTLLAAVYARYGDLTVLRNALAGVAAAAAGLIIAVVAKMAGPIFRTPYSPAPFVAVASFLAIGLFRWPLLDVLAVLAPLSIALAYWRLRT